MEGAEENYGCVLFEDTSLGSVKNELLDWKAEDVRHLLIHIINIQSGKANYRTNLVFLSYENIPLFKPEFGGNVAIYAVEELEEEDIKISILFAGRRGMTFAVNGKVVWQGENDEELKNNIIRPRCEAHFY